VNGPLATEKAERGSDPVGGRYGAAFPEYMPDGRVWPKISIVTPSFNQGEFLEQTICSVLNQGYPNLEYIIMDGGSSDHSIEIIKKYESHLAYWTSEKDGGQYDAINKGFSRATGEIMAWLNSDDVYCPWALRTIAEVFVDLPEVDWLTTEYPGKMDCVGHCLGFGRIKGYAQEAFLNGAYLPSRHKSICWIQQESTFWRRSLWDKVDGLDCKISLSADFDLWCRFYAVADLFALGSPLACFRFQAGQKSELIEHYLDEAEKSLAKLRQSMHWKPKVLRQAVLNLRINEIPKLRGLFASKYYFQGKRICRENLRKKDAKWTINEYSFFYR